MPRGGSRRRSHVWMMSAEDFQALVANSDYMVDVVKAFADAEGGSCWEAVKNRIAEDGLDTSHFKGRGGRSLEKFGVRLDQVSLKTLLIIGARLRDC